MIEMNCDMLTSALTSFFSLLIDTGQEKLHNVHLASEHVHKAKHLIKHITISLKLVPGPQIYLEGSVD